MTRRIDRPRVVFLAVGFAVGVLTSVFVGPSLSGDSEVLRLLVTAFSILAGIIIAVIAVLGNPQHLDQGSWRVASAHRREVRRRLHRYGLLFYTYLIVMVLSYVAIVLEDRSVIGIASCFERLALGAGASAFFWSFVLPRTIIRSHVDALNSEVERRRGQSKDAEIDPKTGRQKQDPIPA